MISTHAHCIFQYAPIRSVWLNNDMHIENNKLVLNTFTTSHYKYRKISRSAILKQKRTSRLCVVVGVQPIDMCGATGHSETFLNFVQLSRRRISAFYRDLGEDVLTPVGVGETAGHHKDRRRPGIIAFQLIRPRTRCTPDVR